MDEIIAKQIIGRDCDFMWGRGTVDPGECPMCGNRIKKVPNLDYANYKLTQDLYVTWDCYQIVSERYRHFCMHRHLEGLKFIKLPKTNGYFYFEPTLIYPLDNLHTELRFDKFRNCCKQYNWVGGDVKYYGSMKFENERFIRRTVWLLGGGDIPLIVDLQTADEMVKEGLKGFYFRDIYYYNP